MNKSLSISFLLFFYCSIVFAQNNINSFKYILVPKQFEFQKSQDQHQFNSLVKFLFNRAGYTVLFTDDQYPDDLASDRCLALKVGVNNNPSLFKTKMSIDLFDCYNKKIYSTKEASSKEKEYKKAYYEAIRKTFVDLEQLNYSYDGTVNSSKHEIVAKKIIVAPKEVQVPKVDKVKVTVLEPAVNEVEPVSKLTEIDKKKSTNLRTIEGKFNFENWGESTISKKGDSYTVVGGDEGFEFATIYKTSKPFVFIIKWAAFKQPQLIEINSEGNLVIDGKKGFKTYKRIH